MFVINQFDYVFADYGFGIGRVWNQSELNCAWTFQVRDNCSSASEEVVEHRYFKDSAAQGAWHD